MRNNKNFSKLLKNYEYIINEQEEFILGMQNGFNI